MFLINFNFVNTEKLTEEMTIRHRNYLMKQYKANQFLIGGRKEPRTGGVIISGHQSEAQLKTVLESDPFVTSGIAEYEITEFIPVMASKEFEQYL